MIRLSVQQIVKYLGIGYLLIGFCHSSVLAQANPVLTIDEVPKIDGDLSDWSDTFEQSSKENWYYALSYDQSFIYVGMAILDIDLQYQILMCGLTCWVKTKGGKKNLRGIRYPIGLPESQRPSDSETFMAYMKEIAVQKRRIIKETEGLELVNFNGKGEATWGESVREDGLKMFLGMNAEGDMLYELAIPRSLFPELWETKNSKGQAIDFSMIWETGSLGRPKDISGTDAIGISGGATSNPVRYQGESVREIHARQDQYRAYARPRKLFVKKIHLSL